MRELDERAHVQVDHAQLRGQVARGQRSRLAVAGVVDQHVDRQPPGLDQAGELPAAGDRAEVVGDGCRGDFVVPGQSGGDLLQGVLGARGQDEVVPVPRKAIGQVDADPTGGSGDERRLALARSLVRHRSAPPVGL